MAVLARKIGKHIIPVVEKFTELEIDRPLRRGTATSGPCIGVRVKLAARGAGRWKSQRRLSLEVRPDLDRSPGSLRIPQAARHGRLPATGALPPGQPDHQHPQHQERPDGSGPDLRRTGTASAPAFDISTSAAAWASTTTARRPTSSQSSTTRCRNTPTTWSFASRASATRPACPIRPSSPSRAGPSSPTTACWSSTCWACPTSTATRCRRRSRPTSRSRSATCSAIYRDLNKKNFLEGYHDAVQAMDEALEPVQSRLA